MTMDTGQIKSQTSKLPMWLSGIGILAWIGTAVFEGRLIWEQTILSWEQGPQMIGFALVHGKYFFLLFTPFILLVWLIATLSVTIVALWRKKRVSVKRWVSLCLTCLLLAVFFLPESFWLRLSIDRISSGPYAVDFLTNAAATGDLKTVEELLSRGVSINASKPRNGTTALHAAAVGGDMNVIKYLVHNGANINAVDSSGKSPLDNAFSMNNDEVAKFLSDRGALRIGSTDPDSIEISKIVIVYLDWISINNKKLECADLFYKENPNQIVIGDVVEIEKWIALTNEMSIGKVIVRQLLDARICVVMFSKEGHIVREVSFGNYIESPYMEIDQQIFDFNEALFEYTISYLPKNYIEDEKLE